MWRNNCLTDVGVWYVFTEIVRNSKFSLSLSKTIPSVMKIYNELYIKDTYRCLFFSLGFILNFSFLNKLRLFCLTYLSTEYNKPEVYGSLLYCLIPQSKMWR